MSITCLIIDDEPSSQNVLKQFVTKLDFLTLMGICNNAIEATEFLNTTPVDLLFLDINMPHLSGLSFYKSLEKKPAVIFTTAYSEYAIEGFDVNATDYLLKPFSFERFFKAVTKARTIISTKSEQEHIIIKADKKLHQIHISDIIFIEALGDYIKIHLDNNTLINYSTLSKIKNVLPSTSFIQVHKSFVINIKKLEYIEGNLITIKGYKIPIGKKYKTDFLDALKN